MNNDSVVRVNISYVIVFFMAMAIVLLSSCEIFIRFFKHSNAVLIFLTLVLLSMEVLIIVSGNLVPMRVFLYCFLMSLILLRNNGWSFIRNIQFISSLLLLVVLYYHVNIAKVVLNISLFCYSFFAIATIFLFFNRDIYMNYVVNLFPTSRKFLIYLYNAGLMAGFTDHYSTNGMLIASGAIIAICNYLAEKKLSMFLLSLIMEIALLLTGKRAHVLFSFFAIFIVYFISLSYGTKKIKKWIYLLGTVLILCTLLYFVMTFAPALSSSFIRIKQFASGKDNISGRWTLWKNAIILFEQNPLLGIGWKNYPSASHVISRNFTITSFMDAHNIYLQLLSEAGIVGFVIYISWILNSVYISYITCKNAVRMNVDVKDKKIIFFSLAFQIFFILYGVTGNPLYESMMFIPYFTAGGITLFYYRSLGTKTKKIYGENEWVEKKNW